MTGTFREDYRNERKPPQGVAGGRVGATGFTSCWQFRMDPCVAGEIRRPKSETRKKAEIRNPNPPAHPLTQRRRDSQRFAKSNFPLCFSAFLCSAIAALSPVPKSETRRANCYRQPVSSDFDSRISAFFRVSGFGLRISTRAARLVTGSFSAQYLVAPNRDSIGDNPDYSAVRGFPGGAGRIQQLARPRWRGCAAPAGRWSR